MGAHSQHHRDHVACQVVTLPFLRARSRLVNSVLERLPDQCWVVLNQIQQSRARCDAVGPTGGSSPLAEGPLRPRPRLWSINGSAHAV